MINVGLKQETFPFRNRFTTDFPATLQTRAQYK